jgi:hypothetical protein
MAIRILPHSEEFRDAALAFNLRMRAAGSPWGVYVEPECDWLPKRPGRRVWREHHLAIDDQGAVHGGFTLKPQEWWVQGGTQVVTDWQGPFSEGSVDSAYAMLAVKLMRDMVSKRPALFSWGHGGGDQPVVQMLRKMGWLIHETPLCLLVLNPFRFLRRTAFLRRSASRRFALDAAAFSGIGSIGLRTLHFALRALRHKSFSATASTFDGFEPWADELWERCKHSYAAIALRDAESMNLLAPFSSWPPVTRLRVERAGDTIGWALVMHTRMHADARFGDLHVGSIVDCLANPLDAGEIVSASTQYLRAEGVDIVVSNQSHPGWISGFADNGYVVLPKLRLFVASPALRDLLTPFEQTAHGLHLTNMDGHGPHAL